MGDRVTKIIWGVTEPFPMPAGVEDIDDVFGVPYGGAPRGNLDETGTFDWGRLALSHDCPGVDFFGIDAVRVASGAVAFVNGEPVFDRRTAGRSRELRGDQDECYQIWRDMVCYLADRWGISVTAAPGWLVVEHYT